MPMLPVTGGELYYEDGGDGDRAIVFAHGAGGNHMSWWQQVPHFSRRYRCITIDHRGFGQSLDHSGETMRAYRRDLEELLDHLGIASTAIVAQSMGGFTGMTFAGTHPERVWALVMANTFLGVGDEDLVARARKHWEGLSQIDPAGPAAEQTTMVGQRFKDEHPEGVFLYQQVRSATPRSTCPARTRSRTARSPSGTSRGSRRRYCSSPARRTGSYRSRSRPRRSSACAARASSVCRRLATRCTGRCPRCSTRASTRSSTRCCRARRRHP